MVERARLAAGYLERAQSPRATWTFRLRTSTRRRIPRSWFRSGHSGLLAQRYEQREPLGIIEPFLRKAGSALAVGGIHTPNHRWVVSSALAQIHEVFPDPSYPRRIAQWLAEGIDIDEAGQYTERSTGVYNPIVDRALVVMAAKLNRPELLDPVRRNLDSMLYLLHPGYEVVTEISHRQDQYGRADMGGYWFPLQFLAVRDGNGRFATLARHFALERASLSALMEYPELSQAGPTPEPVPDQYERELPELGIARIRRGPLSATVLLQGDSRL